MTGDRCHCRTAVILHVLGGLCTVPAGAAGMMVVGAPGLWLSLAGLLRISAAVAMAGGSVTGRRICALFNWAGLIMWTANGGLMGFAFGGVWHIVALSDMAASGRAGIAREKLRVRF